MIGKHSRRTERNSATMSAVSGLVATDRLRIDDINADAPSQERILHFGSDDAVE